jgi:large subunit ribosomal protein L4
MMATINVVDINNNTVESISLSDGVFQQQPKGHILHLVVRGQRAVRRSGTAKTKTRGEVRLTGAKMYRQKGTGRARAGSGRSPVRVGGGIAFGPVPRSYAFKIPKKVRRTGVISALSQKLSEGNLIVVDRLSSETGKTKAFLDTWLKLIGERAKTLIVIPEKDEMLWRSCRNIPEVKLTFAGKLSVYDLLNYSKLIIVRPALQKIEEVYGS